jgi:hypothetical protein
MATLTAFSATHGFTAGDLDLSGYVAAVSAYQQVFIADGRPYNADIHLSGYHKINFTGTKITGVLTGSISVGDSVTQDTSLAEGVVSEILSATSYLIYRTKAIEFNATNHIHKDAGNYITPSAVTAPPHWLNWTLTAGEFPDGGSNVMTLFEGRLWMNSMFHPNQWFATEQDDPLNLLPDSADVQAAITSQSSEAGQVADPLVSLIAYNDNYLIYGLANFLYILRGGSTGSDALSCFTKETGIFSPDSYCWDNNGNLYIIGLTGFFKVPSEMATGGAVLDNISLRLVPNLFPTIKLNRLTDRVVMGFDRDSNIIEVAISTQDGVWKNCFSYDVANDAIIPDTFPVGKVPSSFLYVNSYQDDLLGLLVGCYDGFVRKFDRDAKDDDGEAIDSYCLFGPITVEDVIRANIKIKEIQIILSEDSDGLSWYLYQGKSNEEIVAGIKGGTITPTHTGTFTAGGRQVSISEKIAGESIAILFRNTVLGTSWGLEGVKIKYSLSGSAKDN